METVSDNDYLVSYGNAGDFGRFRAVASVRYERGDEVVLKTSSGLEVGVVMCPSTPGHERFLSRTPLGELLRPVSTEDRKSIENGRVLAQRIFEHGCALAVELTLPLEIVDVEPSLDGKRAIVHHLRRQDCDYRALVSRLSRAFDVFIVMENMALPTLPEDSGCGRPDCGQGGGGCTSCGSGGCGTCGKGTSAGEVSAYLAGLRDAMERSDRTPLL